MRKVFQTAWKAKGFLKKILPAKARWYCKNMLIQLLTAGFQSKKNSRNFLSRPVGVNLIGDIKIESGLGQSMRLLANTLDKSQYPFGIFDIPLSDSIRRNDNTWDRAISREYPYGVNLVHINPPDLGAAYLNTDKELWKNRYNIGFWLWELEEYPKVFRPNIKFVDEIWTPSEFISNCFRKITDKPVRTIPYHVTAEVDSGIDRAYFGLPEEQFLFLVMFDFNSSMERKNPIGAIKAYTHAFSGAEEGTGIVVKVNNPTDECMSTLRQLLKDQKNVYYITDTLDKREVNSLISCVDVMVSLHRAEGFGLTMAEAMLLKTACIATNWSSNTEFMNSEVACMVPYKLVSFQKGESYFAGGGTWADADIEEASRYMKKLKEDPEYYRNMVERAYAYVSTVLGKEKIVNLLESRLGEIYGSTGVYQ